MAEFLAAVVALGTAVAIVAAIYQVESHPTATKNITSSGQNVVDTTVQSLFK